MPQWMWDRLGTWARRAAAAALVGGGATSRPVPRHVAFIMDGNRRFAEARCLRKVEGHAFGYRRLIDALEWCLDLGVTCVSVYAFSIDNYRRSGEEVETLMALAEEKLAHMLQECDVLARHGVQVRVIGDLSLAPHAVQQAAAAVMSATAHHTRAVLNLCFSYTASEELLHAMGGLAAGTVAAVGPGSGSSSCGGGGCHSVQPLGAAAGCTSSCSDCGGGASMPGSSSSQPSSSYPSSNRICGSGPPTTSATAAAAAFEQQLYTAGCPPVDLLVRTSGETRLSDFLLWQTRHALLVFTPVLWPDFGFLDLVAAVMEFQRHAAHLQRLQASAARQAAVAQTAMAAAEAADAGAEAAAAMAAAAGEPASPLRWAQELQPCTQLKPVKVIEPEQQQQQQQRGSPCSVASPASPSSPSSRSEGSAAEDVAIVTAGAAPVAAAAAAGASEALRQRRAATAAPRAIL